MRIVTRLFGTKPLLMHNVQLANPDNRWARAISRISGKKKKTEDDRKEMSRLEFQGSLYTDGGKVVVPTANILKCFNESAKITKQGRMITRALTPVNLTEPLIYHGPQTIDELVESEEFYDMTIVNVRGQRVVRTRPIFRDWAVSAEWELQTELLDYEDLRAIATRAGIAEGLGDNRTNGWGRFKIEIAEAKELKEAA